MAALWVYDYILTLKDEVTELYDDNGADRNLIIPCRSVMHGRWRGFSVREPSDFSWSALTNSFSVFVLFLFVGALH